MPRFQSFTHHGARRRALTLIELMVSLAVILLLVAITIPAINGVRSRMHNATNISNLRQSGNYLLMDATLNGNVLEIKSGGGSGGGDRLWPVIVTEMITPGMHASITTNKTRTPSLDILYSPKFFPFRHSPEEATWTWSTYGVFAIALGDYASRVRVDVGETNYNRYQVNLLAAGHELANYPLLMDSIMLSQNPPAQRMAITSFTATASGTCVHMRNNGLAHAVFLDGSVRELDKVALRNIGFNSAVSEQGAIFNLNDN